MQVQFERKRLFSVLLKSWMISPLASLFAWTTLAFSSLCSQHLYHLLGVTQNEENKRWFHCIKNEEGKYLLFKSYHIFMKIWKESSFRRRKGCANSVGLIFFFFLLPLQSTFEIQIPIQNGISFKFSQVKVHFQRCTLSNLYVIKQYFFHIWVRNKLKFGVILQLCGEKKWQYLRFQLSPNESCALHHL